MEITPRLFVILLMAVKIPYLILEVAFNGQLVRVLGGQNSESIHSLEVYGRIFSSFAVGLLFLRIARPVLFDDIDEFRPRLAAALFCVAAFVMFFGQRAFVNYIAASSNEKVRQSAYRSLMLVSATDVYGRKTIVDGFNFSSQADSDAITFSALIGPTLALNQGAQDFVRSHSDAISDIVTKKSDEIQGGCDKYEAAVNDFYLLYEKYRDATVILSKIYDQAPAQAEREYEDFVFRLKASDVGMLSNPGRSGGFMHRDKGDVYSLTDEKFYGYMQSYFSHEGNIFYARQYSKISMRMFGRYVDPHEFCDESGCPGNVDFFNDRLHQLKLKMPGVTQPESSPSSPEQKDITEAMMAERARALAKREGINLPSNWVPSDKAGFVEAAAIGIRNAADVRFAKQLLRSPLHAKIPPGMTIQEFEKIPAVQNYIQKHIQDVGGGTLPTSIHADCTLMVSKILKRNLSLSLIAPSTDFENGGSYAVKGRNAVRSMMAPILSLTFSLFFGIVNAYGFLVLGWGLVESFLEIELNFSRRVAISIFNSLIFPVLVIFVPFVFIDGLSGYPGYDLILRSDKVNSLEVVNLMLRWLFHLQPVFLHVGDWASGLIFPEGLSLPSLAYDLVRGLDFIFISWLPGGCDPIV